MLERGSLQFELPLDAWLRGPLKAWAEELLAEDRLRREGFFNPEPIRQRWRDHLLDRRDWQRSLWAVLMFQAWLAETQSQGRPG
jgi:asparagine synthase (glutamine-hydrolysing)